MSIFRRRFTAQGAPPGVVVPPERTITPEVSLFTYDAQDFEEQAVGVVSELRGRTEGPRVAWIDVRGLGDGAVVQELGALLGLHPLAVSDVVNLGQRPKVDQYDEVLFLVLHMATMNGDGRLRWEQVSLFLGAHYVLTFQESYEDCLEPLRNLVRAGRTQVRASGADYLACMVIDGIVDGYFPILEHYGERLEEFEDTILGGHRRDVLGPLYVAKRDLAAFRRACWPLREALAHMLREDGLALSEPARLHLRDALDHTMQVVEVNESYRELSASLVEVHLSMVGQRTNDIMRVLTVVSTIFIPLTFLAGVYGMNFDTRSAWNMPELSWPFGYLAFWAVSLGLASGLLLLFRRLGWLRRQVSSARAS